MAIGVRPAVRGEYEELTDVLTRAFVDDPVIEWFFPEPTQRARRVRRFFGEIVLGIGLSELTEVSTTDDLRAVAVWAPPDQWRVGVGRQLRMLPRYVSIASIRWAPSRLAAFNQIEAHHPKGPPHWYLPTLGTDPGHQGKGLGSALLADRLERCDAAGLPAYLESSKESNVPFYERHGFVVTETFDLPDGPRLWLMWRDPLLSEPAVEATRVLLHRGLALEYATLAWNVVGAGVVLAAAVIVGSVALTGFGIDSLIEIGASVVVVWQLREVAPVRETLALRLIGGAFLALGVYLGVQAGYALATHAEATTSPLGMGWLAATVVVMVVLAVGKSRTGAALHHAVLSAEARVTMVDAALAAAVLVGIAVDAVLGWWWADPVAGLVIVAYAASEARTVFRRRAP